jgi:membrane protein DedA with SNARE-associated domain
VNVFDPHALHDLIAQFGLPLLFLFVMSESAGVPVPGETALVAAAVYAGSSGRLSLEAVIAVAAAAAIAGDNPGYVVGYRYGRALIERHGERIGLTAARWRLARYLVGRYGLIAVFTGRFVAILRALSGVVAGAAGMPWWRFFIANAAGAIVWASIYGFAAHTFGAALPHLTHAELALVVCAVLAASLISMRYIAKRSAMWQAEADRLYTEPVSGERDGQCIRTSSKSS